MKLDSRSRIRGSRGCTFEKNWTKTSTMCCRHCVQVSYSQLSTSARFFSSVKVVVSVTWCVHCHQSKAQPLWMLRRVPLKLPIEHLDASIMAYPPLYVLSSTYCSVPQVPRGMDSQSI